MKFVILGLAAVVAAVMVFFMIQGECSSGKIVATESECRQFFSAELCRVAHQQADYKARYEYAPFPNQDACDRAFPRCMPHGAVRSGFVPVPRSVCVERTAGGIVGTPIYQKHGQTVSYQ